MQHLKIENTQAQQNSHDFLSENFIFVSGNTDRKNWNWNANIYLCLSF